MLSDYLFLPKAEQSVIRCLQDKSGAQSILENFG